MGAHHNTAEQEVETVMARISQLTAAFNRDFEVLAHWLDARNDGIHAAENGTSEALAWWIDMRARAEGFSGVKAAAEAIQGLAMACEVRSAWQPCGNKLLPYEFRVLLAASSNVVELCGELSWYGYPRTARLMYQAYGRPAVEYRGAKLDTAALLDFAARFNFKT